MTSAAKPARTLARASSSPAKIEKFGGPVDRTLALPGALGRWAAALVPGLYRFVPWRFVERVALVIEF